ncbi:MAG: MoxR family ATPase [Proteobacteria bacterium]|nr:MoxR family ATPase [Pseudomonadota bacterium]
MKEIFEDISNRALSVLSELEKVIVGKQQVLKQILTAILADGHILLEDYPGLAKTLIANCYATALGLDFKRIQFTPDLLPSDITGSNIYNRAENRFDLRKGPIFSNIVLADEINRASPKTQSALLEAMQEKQVTIEGETLPLPDPFIVIATQNPIDYEGTFPLPEAQLDRFLVKLSIGYPNPKEEQEILHRRQQRKDDQMSTQRMINAEDLLKIRKQIEEIYMHPDVENYIVQIVGATREYKDISVGASPRGSLALLKLTKAWAALDGRDYILPDDVKAFAKPVLAHRLMLAPALWMNQHAPTKIIDSICNRVPVPAIREP